MVRYDRAGDLLFLEALNALGLAGRVSFFRNNVNHYTGATFGCHENYSLERTAPLTRKNRLSLLAFLTLRVLFTGAGRVGSNRQELVGSQLLHAAEPVPFQISQRADYIVNDCFEWIQHNRAIINLRDEPLADAQRFRRLHLILGDTNVLPSALFLKVGATRLVLDLLEADELPPLALANPVAALRLLSRTPDPPWRVALVGGRTADALALAGLYRQKAKQLFGGRDPETDALLALWARVLAALATDPESLVGVLDWVSKRYLLGQFLARQGLAWDHPWLESQDLKFHHIDPTRSLGLALAQPHGCWNLTGLERAKCEPPGNSRAWARSRLMRKIQDKACSYFVELGRSQRPRPRTRPAPQPLPRRPRRSGRTSEVRRPGAAAYVPSREAYGVHPACPESVRGLLALWKPWPRTKAGASSCFQILQNGDKWRRAVFHTRGEMDRTMKYKMLKTKILLSGLLVVLATVVRAGTNDLTAALQRGLFEEEANHNLPAAIQAYQSVIAQFDKDRKLAATAVFRLGECYRKQGSTNEAAAQYERIVREFADQAPLVELSRQRLPAQAALAAGQPVASEEEKRLLGEEIKLAEQQLATKQTEYRSGVVTYDAVLAAQRELFELKGRRAAMDAGLPGANDEQKRLLDEEIKVVEHQVGLAQVLHKEGVGTQDTILAAQQYLLELKRRKAALEAGQPVSLPTSPPAATSAELEELARIQEMVRNSPDLINAPVGGGPTPLRRAVSQGQLMVVQYLLNNGADVNLGGGSGWDPPCLRLRAAGIWPS